MTYETKMIIFLFLCAFTLLFYKLYKNSTVMDKWSCNDGNCTKDINGTFQSEAQCKLSGCKK